MRVKAPLREGNHLGLLAWGEYMRVRRAREAGAMGCACVYRSRLADDSQTPHQESGDGGGLPVGSAAKNPVDSLRLPMAADCLGQWLRKAAVLSASALATRAAWTAGCWSDGACMSGGR